MSLLISPLGLLPSMQRELTRGFWYGAPFGYAISCLTYGGLGYWIAGTTGLAIGIAIASAFAIAGAIATLRFLRHFEDYIVSSTELEAALATAKPHHS